MDRRLSFVTPGGASGPTLVVDPDELAIRNHANLLAYVRAAPNFVALDHESGEPKVYDYTFDGGYVNEGVTLANDAGWNDKLVIHFAGGQYFTIGNMPTGDAPYDLIIAFRCSASGGNQSIIGGNYPASHYELRKHSDDTLLVIHQGVTIATSPSLAAPTAPHVLAIRRRKGVAFQETTLWIDGALAGANPQLAADDADKRNNAANVHIGELVGTDGYTLVGSVLLLELFSTITDDERTVFMAEAMTASGV